MRELNNKEVAHVSGAGIFSDAGAQIGLAIGKAVNENVAASAELLGKGIGSILEFDIISAINNMSAGIRGIVDWAKSRKAAKAAA